jgi:hippurate hydrolase
VIPAAAEIEGTLRYFDRDVCETLHEQLHQLTASINRAFGCNSNIRIETGYPPTINAEPAVAHARRAARSIGLNVVEDAPPAMAAEDFAFHADHAPIAFAKLGADRDHRPWPPLHTDGFDFNDSLLTPAVAWLARLALRPDTSH